MLYKGDTLYLDWLEDGIAELVFDAQVQLITRHCDRRQPRRGHRRAGTAIRSKRAAAAFEQSSLYRRC